MKPTYKPVCSCENGEYSAMAFGFASGFDQKMSEPWEVEYNIERIVSTWIPETFTVISDLIWAVRTVKYNSSRLNLA